MGRDDLVLNFRHRLATPWAPLVLSKPRLHQRRLVQRQAKGEANVALGEIVERCERIRPAVGRRAICGAYSTSEKRDDRAPAGRHDASSHGI